MPAVMLSEKAQGQFRNLERRLQERMKKTLKRLETDPDAGKPIHPSRFRSLRCGDYRAIYEFLNPRKDVLVIIIGHRSRIYDELAREK